MRYLTIFLLSLLFFLNLTNEISAASSYVLPYPSSMPGSILYKPKILLESISKYWYFGNFGQYKYSLKQSDKYLVEAKTLFEYKQYFHASLISLKASDEYFEKTLSYLSKAKDEGKDISAKRKLLSEAAGKHIEVLKKLSDELPENFEWKPEKEKPTLINIKNDLEESISIRSKYL